MHNFKNGTEQTYGDNNFRPSGRKNCADKKKCLFSALEGQQNFTGYLVFDKKR